MRRKRPTKNVSSRPVSGQVRTCRGCGCTDLRGCREGCWWVGPDLCSSCDQAGSGLPPAEIWIIHAARQVILTDSPGVPMAVCGYVSEAALAAASERGYPTVSELGFPTDCHLGPFEQPREGGWGEAGQVAERTAKELGYELVCESILFDDGEEEDWPEFSPWDMFDEVGDDL